MPGMALLLRAATDAGETCVLDASEILSSKLMDSPFSVLLLPVPHEATQTCRSPGQGSLGNIVCTI